MMTADPSSSNQGEGSSTEALQQEREADIGTDPFSSYFNTDDPSVPPKVLVTTSFKASKATYEFCDELVGVFPGAEFRRRKKGKGFEMGRIAAWAADRGYKHMMVVNEDMKKPSACIPFTIFGGRLNVMAPFCRRLDRDLPAQWPDGILQTHFNRANETDLRTSTMRFWRHRVSFHTRDMLAQPRTTQN